MNHVFAITVLYRILIWTILPPLVFPVSPLIAAEEVQATAPPKSVALRHTRGGAYFISEPLKEEYDRLLARVRTLQAGLDSGRADAGDVLHELKELDVKLEQLRLDIEKKKVLVSPLKVHTQTEEVTFDLGPERLLVVTADHVSVVGWDQPKVKCVLARTVLAPDDKPVDQHLAGLRIVHRHGAAQGTVGMSAAEREADERKFLASEDGRKLTDEQLKPRRELLRQILESFAAYAEFQGRQIDTVEIDGLTHEQGNRQVSVRITSPDGGGVSHASDWQRHTSLTVYVPACKAIAVRGCLGTLDVRGVNGPVLLTRHGSHDRDYNGTFAVRDITGSLTAIDVPLDVVENVRGPVTIRGMSELVNKGTTHDRGLRTLYTPPARKLTCRKIDGDLTASFIRSDLNLEAVSGRIDVRNDFGDTSLVLKDPLTDVPHRIISASGKIDVRISKAVLRKLPVLALTNCGVVRTDAPQDALEDTSFSLGNDTADGARDWRGLKPPQENGEHFLFAGGQVAAILKGEKRPAGLGLISRGGLIEIMVTP